MTLQAKIHPAGKATLYPKLSQAVLDFLSQRQSAYWAKRKADLTPTHLGAARPGDIDAATGQVYGMDGELIPYSDDREAVGLSSTFNSLRSPKAPPEGQSGEQPVSITFAVGDRVSGHDPYDRNYKWKGSVVEITPSTWERCQTIGVKWDKVLGEDRPTNIRWYLPEELRSHLYVLPPIELPSVAQSSELAEALPAPAPMSGVPSSEASESEDFKHWEDWEQMSVEERDDDANNFHPDNPNNPDNNPDKGKGFSNELSLSERKGRNPKFTTKTADKIAGCAIMLSVYMYSNDVLDFLTLTLPDMDSCDEACVNININLVIKLFIDKFRNHFSRLQKKLKLLDPIRLEHVGVIELSPKAIKQGKAKWHLHIVFRNRLEKGGKRLIHWRVTDKIWQDAVNRYTSKPYSIKCNQMKKVKHCAASYLSKYMSKGGEEQLEKLKLLGIQIPIIHQWYFIARSISQFLEQWIECHKVDFEYFGGLNQAAKDLSNSLYRSKIKGVKDKDPILVSRTGREGEEILVALILFFESQYREAFGGFLTEVLGTLDKFNRQSQYYQGEIQRAG